MIEYLLIFKDLFFESIIPRTIATWVKQHAVPGTRAMKWAMRFEFYFAT